MFDPVNYFNGYGAGVRSALSEVFAQLEETPLDNLAGRRALLRLKARLIEVEADNQETYLRVYRERQEGKSNV